MITRVFWTLFTIESLAFVLLLVFLFGRGTKGWGPEGPVGAIVLLIPPVILIAVAAVAAMTKSDGVKLACTIFLAMPLVQAALGPLYTAYTNHQTERSLAGDDNFHRPAQRELAHAIRAHDAASVQRLIPGAGDLNRQYEGETLLRFAIANADSSEASLQVVKALLDHGANPNVAAYSSNWPLTLAILKGPALTRLLIDAGADPDQLDEAGRPLWWDALTSIVAIHEGSIDVLLKHGVDLTKRDNESGPVGYAAYHKNWRAVWKLIERGAEWKSEERYGSTMSYMLASDLQYRRGDHSEIPEEMLKVADILGVAH
jgi:hypothetical protein